MSFQPRQPQGVPTGGQFAAQPHAEADITLDPPPAPNPRDRLQALIEEYDSIEEFNDSSEAAAMLDDFVRASRDVLSEERDPYDMVREAKEAMLTSATSRVIEQIRKAYPDSKTARFGSFEVSFDGEFGTQLYLEALTVRDGFVLERDDIEDLAAEFEEDPEDVFLLNEFDPDFFKPNRTYNLDLDTGGWSVETPEY